MFDRGNASVLPVKYPTRRALLASVHREGESVSLFVPGEAAVTRNVDVRLKVAFGDSNKNYYLSGTVQSVILAGANAGFTLGLRTDADRQSFEYAFAYCSKNQQPAARFHSSIDCTVDLGRDKVPARIKDLSLTGAFVASRRFSLLKLGDQLGIDVKGGFLGLGRIHVQGKVVWTGEKNGVPGFGIQFVGDLQGVRSLLKRQGLAAS